jgi:serine/threonine-protein kinase
LTFPAWVHPLAVSVAGTSLVVLIGTGTWALVSSIIRAIPSIPVVQAPKLPELPEVSGEASRINKILNRRQALEIQEGFFNLAVNELFYTENPEAQGRNLTSNAEDEPLRTEWYSTAEEFIDTLDSAKLSANARQRLGSYSQRDFDNWTRKAQAGELGDYTIEQLTQDTDKKFKQLFAEQSSGNLNQKTFGQIWYAIAADKVSQLEAK